MSLGPVLTAEMASLLLGRLICSATTWRALRALRHRSSSHRSTAHSSLESAGRVHKAEDAESVGVVMVLSRGEGAPHDAPIRTLPNYTVHRQSLGGSDRRPTRIKPSHHIRSDSPKTGDNGWPHPSPSEGKKKAYYHREKKKNGVNPNVGF